MPGPPGKKAAIEATFRILPRAARIAGKNRKVISTSERMLRSTMASCFGRVQLGDVADEAKTGIVDENVGRRVRGLQSGRESVGRPRAGQIERQQQGPAPA